MNKSDGEAIANCSCIPHYYETNSVCAICYYKCDLCTGPSSNKICDSCSDKNRSVVSIREYPSTQDKCMCNNTFYNSGTDTECKACIYPCLW